MKAVVHFSRTIRSVLDIRFVFGSLLALLDSDKIRSQKNYCYYTPSAICRCRLTSRSRLTCLAKGLFLFNHVAYLIENLCVMQGEVKMGNRLWWNRYLIENTIGNRFRVRLSHVHLFLAQSAIAVVIGLRPRRNKECHRRRSGSELTRLDE